MSEVLLLSQVSELNPKVSRIFECDELVSFVSMSAVTVDGETSEGEDRLYSEVSRGYTAFKSGDLLVAKITPCFENGKIAQATLSRSYGFGSTEFHVIRPNSERLDSRYLFHFLRQKSIRLDGALKMTGSAGHRRVPASFFSGLKILVPPIVEQRRISSILDKVRSLISKRYLCLRLLDLLCLSFMEEVFSEAEEKDSWMDVVVGDVSEVQGGLQVTSARKSNSKEAPYLRVANVYRGFLDLGEVKKIRVTDAELTRTLLETGDVLIVEGHGNPEEVGRCALWDGTVDGCTHQNHLIRARFDVQKVLPRFACDYLNSSRGRRHLFRAGKTTSGLNTISVSDVRSAPLLIPPLAIQQQYLNRTEIIDAIRLQNREHLAELEVLFTSLQHRAFRGEL
ncbi:restriction endonuclease subunit S [Pseudomonas sp. A1437]|uniref:restriction endonuclease subunit S n=1 Tax=unclassified Pseudomonas TaxID=196821 RepID=UPI003784739B